MGKPTKSLNPISVKGVWWRLQSIGKQLVTKELGGQGRGEQQLQRTREMFVEEIIPLEPRTKLFF